MTLYLSEIIKMKFMYWTTRDDYDDYKEIEINTIDELLELIKNSEWKQVVIQQDDTERLDGTRSKHFGKWFIEDYNDRRE